MERDCDTCIEKMLCIVCNKKLCHIHEMDRPDFARIIDGHYTLNGGIICVVCFPDFLRRRKP